MTQAFNFQSGRTQAFPGQGGFDLNNFTNLAFWVKADSGDLLDGSDAPITADGTAVKTWPDQSSNANDLTQTTGVDQPSFETNEINGLPVVEFDGTTYLIGEAASDGEGDVDWGTGDAMVYVVFETTQAGQGRLIDRRGTGALGSQDGWFVRINTGINEALVETSLSGSHLSQFALDQSFDEGGAHLLVLEWKNSVPSWTAYKDGGSGTAALITGTPAGQAVNATFTNDRQLTVGTASNPESQSFVGKIGEIAVFKQTHTDAQRGEITNYLKDKWGIS